MENVYFPAQSIFDGTWGSGPPPHEMFIFVLCDQLKISPKQLREEFSPYEQRYFWDFYQLKWEQENAEMERAKSSGAHHG